MLNIKKITLVITFFCIVSFLFSQNYDIRVKINGIKDTVIYLGHHFGEKKFAVDTAQIDNKGNAVFQKDKELNRGVYMIFTPTSKGMNYFELIISEKYPKFSIETDTTDYIKYMKIKGSSENVVFYEYQRKIQELWKIRKAIENEYELTLKNNEDISEIKNKYKSVIDEGEQYMYGLVSKYPDYFLSKYIKSMLEVKIPEAPTDENENIIDPAFNYLYLKKHYWDNIDLSENGLLRTPIYESKLNYFFSKLVVPLPDSLIYDCHNLIQKVYDAGDTLMFQYTCSHLFSMFDTSKIMGYDAVFVSIAEDWYLSGKATWIDTTLFKKIAERVDKITPTRIGNICYNLEKMQSFDDKYYSLHNLKADYIILAFYEPSCGYCKKEIPKLIKEYNDTLKNMGVKVFAIYTQYDKDEWLKFINDKGMNIEGWYNVWDGPYPHSKFRDFYDLYSTPLFYILDKEKKIIAKRIGIEDFKNFILNYEKR